MGPEEEEVREEEEAEVDFLMDPEEVAGAEEGASNSSSFQPPNPPPPAPALLLATGTVGDFFGGLSILDLLLTLVLTVALLELEVLGFFVVVELLAHPHPSSSSLFPP